MSDFASAALRIETAVVAEDVFGTVGGPDALTAVFRDFVRIVHPDKHPLALARATTVLQKLTTLREHAEQKLKDGTYGDRKVPNVPPPKPVHVPTVIKTKTKTYTVEALLEQGDIADLYRATTETGEHVCFKLARAAGDNDLLENEERTLKALDPKKRAEKAALLLPQLVDSFLFRSASSTRRVNVLTLHRDYYSLVEVHQQHPKLDYRDAVWMFKRALMALGLVHRHNVVHGAVLPPHILVHPVNHGAKLVDWCYAVEDLGQVRAIAKDWRAFYAPEILAKQPAVPATDIYMLVNTIIWLIGGDVETRRMPHTVPAHFQGFLTGCLMRSPARRPDDAWKLLDELDEMLRRLVGKPKYRLLEMPARS